MFFEKLEVTEYVFFLLGVLCLEGSGIRALRFICCTFLRISEPEVLEINILYGLGFRVSFNEDSAEVVQSFRLEICEPRCEF